MVLPRVLTALALIPLVLAVVWFGSLPYFIFVAGVCLFAYWEYALMADAGGYPNQLVMGLGGTAVILFAFYLDGVPWGPLQAAPSVFFVFIVWMFAVFLREFVRRDKGLSFLRVITTIGGVLLCAVSMGHLLLVRDLRYVGGEGTQLIGRELVFFLLTIIWSFDTGSWATGLLAGRSSLAPRLSPKKSWEGFVGGLVLAALTAWLFKEIFVSDILGSVEVVVYAVVISLTSSVSDLIESMMKRTFGVKDSSQLLPGHGGILDRFDSFLFAAPFFYYLLIGSGRFR